MSNSNIETGYSYKTFERFGKTKVFHIFHKQPDGERPYVGLEKETGRIVDFDSWGRDKHMECGGYWYRLDLSTKQTSDVKLINQLKEPEE